MSSSGLGAISAGNTHCVVCAWCVQVRGVVAIKRATHRTFDATEWQVLAKQLAGWRDSIKAVRATLASQAASGVAAPAAAPSARPVRA